MNSLGSDLSINMPSQEAKISRKEEHQYCRVDFATLAISALMIIILFSLLDTIRIIFRYFWAEQIDVSTHDLMATICQSAFILFMSIVLIYAVHLWAHYRLD
jgi:hypothetical protein